VLLGGCSHQGAPKSAVADAARPDFLLCQHVDRRYAWQALVATAVGKWLPGIVPLNAVLGAAFTYFILARLTQRPVLVQEASKC
jgi:hypothetical protein